MSACLPSFLPLCVDVLATLLRYTLRFTGRGKNLWPRFLPRRQILKCSSVVSIPRLLPSPSCILCFDKLVRDTNLITYRRSYIEVVVAHFSGYYISEYEFGQHVLSTYDRWKCYVLVILRQFEMREGLIRGSS